MSKLDKRTLQNFHPDDNISKQLNGTSYRTVSQLVEPKAKSLKRFPKVRIEII